jgi:hypothetical protein
MRNFLNFLAIILLFIFSLTLIDQAFKYIILEFLQFALPATLIAFFVFLACLLIVFPFLWMHMRERIMVDGAFPLIRRVRRRWSGNLWRFLEGEEELFVDPNRIQSPMFSIDRQTGRILELEPPGGWDRQAQYNAIVEETNITRAAVPGDDKAWIDIFPWSHATVASRPVPRAERAKQLPASTPPHPPPVADEKPLLIPPPRPSFADALALTNRQAGELPLGYTVAGEIVMWDANIDPHLRIHGQSRRAGKTNLIKQMMVAALEFGHKVVLADRRAQKDFGVFGESIEFVNVLRTGEFMRLLNALVEEYQRRDKFLAAEGAGDILAMANPFHRIFVAINEFGSLLRDAAQTPDFQQIRTLLINIVSESGATGIHLLLEDQVQYDLARTIKGNVRPVTGFLERDSVAGGGYRKADSLGLYEFHFNGKIFTPWNMRDVAPSRVTRHPPLLRSPPRDEAEVEASWRVSVEGEEEGGQA